MPSKRRRAAPVRWFGRRSHRGQVGVGEQCRQLRPPMCGEAVERHPPAGASWSASSQGPKGRIRSVSCARPRRTRNPSRVAPETSSSRRRVLPMPDSPRMAASHPSARRAAPSNIRSRASSPSRPTSGRGRWRALGSGHQIAAGRDGGLLASASRTPQHAAVEPPGPGVGLEPELLLQDVHAGLVLAERRATAPEPSVDASTSGARAPAGDRT